MFTKFASECHIWQGFESNIQMVIDVYGDKFDHDLLTRFFKVTLQLQ